DILAQRLDNRNGCFAASAGGHKVATIALEQSHLVQRQRFAAAVAYRLAQRKRSVESFRGFRVFTLAAIDTPDAGEGIRFTGTLPDGPINLECLIEILQCSRALPEGIVRPARVIEHGRFAKAVAYGTLDWEGLFED